MGRPAESKPIPGMAQWRNMGGAGLQDGLSMALPLTVSHRQ